MTALKIAAPDPQAIAECLIAGRRAALGAGVALIPNAQGAGEETYDGVAFLQIKSPDGFDIGPLIDAAVIETVARVQAQAAISAPKRPWWRFWA